MSDRDHHASQPATGERSYTVPAEVPVLPLRDTVLFPNSFMPLAVARESSVKLIDEAIAGGKVIGVFTQKDPTQEEPGAGRPAPDRHADAHPQDVQAARRQPAADRPGPGAHPARSTSPSTQPYLRAEVTRGARGRSATPTRSRSTRSQRNIRANFQQVVQLSPVLSDDLTALAANITEPGRLADFIASSLDDRSAPRPSRSCWRRLDVRARMDQLNRILTKELEVLELGSKIQSQVQSEVGKNQREYFLREQMKAIQKELGEGDEQAQGDRRAAREDRRRRHARGRQEGGAARARPAVEDAGRGRRVHRRAHLHRLARRAAVGEAHRRGHRPRAAPRACSTPTTRASSARRTASSSTSPSAS